MYHIYWRDTSEYTHHYNNHHSIDFTSNELWVKVKNARGEIVLVAPATSILRIEVDNKQKGIDIMTVVENIRYKILKAMDDEEE